MFLATDVVISDVAVIIPIISVIIGWRLKRRVCKSIVDVLLIFLIRLLSHPQAIAGIH